MSENIVNGKLAKIARDPALRMVGSIIFGIFILGTIYATRNSDVETNSDNIVAVEKNIRCPVARRESGYGGYSIRKVVPVIAGWMGVLDPGEVDRYDEFQVIDGVNDRLDFEETSATELTAEIAEGVYTASSLATALDTALTAAGASAYTITYDFYTGKFKIASDRAGGGGTFKILWNTGTNNYRSIARLLGFQDDADDADAASQTSDDSVLGIPGDLEHACLELTLYKYHDSPKGRDRAGLKSKQISGQNAGTHSYIIDMPPKVEKALLPYMRHMV
ncbi:hypothetical protein LCGC14_1387460 [marine sediment metagenome]|uniref:Uncharacterized protein n=1 Tax=marine sediment metagenome TaxID=412755 RepID=A0A0F9K0Z3_9ZZZZ